MVSSSYSLTVQLKMRNRKTVSSHGPWKMEARSVKMFLKANKRYCLNRLNHLAKPDKKFHKKRARRIWELIFHKSLTNFLWRSIWEIFFPVFICHLHEQITFAIENLSKKIFSCTWGFTIYPQPCKKSLRFQHIPSSPCPEIADIGKKAVPTQSSAVSRSLDENNIA